MKKGVIMLSLAALLVLGACSTDEVVEVKEEKTEPIEEAKKESEKKVEEKKDAPVKKVEEPAPVDANTINTSVFEYAKNVEVTDARDITKHITLKIDLSNDAKAGMGTLNVLNQSFDFLQQEDIQGADTITILIRVNEVKVSQFNIRVNDFHPNTTDSMAHLVLAASDIEFLTPEVEEFGQGMELW